MSSRDLENLKTANDLFHHGHYEEAFRLYKELAEQGNVECQSFAGWMYFDGTGVASNDEKALFWLEKAANQGDIQAQFYLAKLHLKKGECDSALNWLEQAAAKEYAPAMFLLGHMYQLGRCVVPDEDKAFHLISRAADAGHLFARREYARFLMKGRLGLANVFKGVRIYLTLFFPAIRAAVADPYTDRLRV